MDSLSGEHVIGTFAHRFSEPEELAASLVGGEFEYLRIPGQAFGAGNLRITRVADLVLQQAEDGPHITRGAIAADLAALILPLRLPDGAAQVNGSAMRADHAVLAPGCTEFVVSCTERQDWAAAALPLSSLDSWAELVPGRLVQQGHVTTLALPPIGADRLCRAFESAAAFADEPAATAGIANHASGLASSFTDLLCEVLTNEASELPRSRAAREAYRVVRAADGFLEAEMSRPVYREQLCAALGISLRKLHDAFVAVTGLSPQVYLKTRRLASVRRALLAGGDGPVLVKSVALAHGFWHFGYFAQDYKALFGESPSATLAGVSRRNSVTTAWA